MNKNSDIICFALFRSDAAISSSALMLAKELAKTNRVWYIEHPYSWKDYFKEKKTPEVQSRKNALLKGKDIYKNPSSIPTNMTIVTPRLTFPLNFLPEGKLYNSLSRINNKIISDTICKVIKDNDIKDFIYVNFFDPHFLTKLPADLKPVRTVYYSMDDISQVEYTRKHGLRQEEETVHHSDYTFCTSRELTRLKSPFSPNVYFSPNAVDINIFKKAFTEKLAKPKEFENINQKIIGFTGSIEYRTDFDLLKKIAVHHHDKILFFVGPINTDEHISVGLDKMSNIIFAGPRKMNELPPYLQYFDCAIIPFRKNTLTNSIYPLKINEYLAAGKPVISTNFSADINSFSDVAYVVNNDEEFLQAIDKAIEEDNDERKQARLKVAEQNTWTVRVQQFWDIISNDPKTSFINA